jgi:hypothetical protein
MGDYHFPRYSSSLDFPGAVCLGTAPRLLSNSWAILVPWRRLFGLTPPRPTLGTTPRLLSNSWAILVPWRRLLGLTPSRPTLGTTPRLLSNSWAILGTLEPFHISSFESAWCCSFERSWELYELVCLVGKELRWVCDRLMVEVVVLLDGF